ncbi:MAG TPA: hypothetical protein VFK69_14610 [Candidatus Eisenbacteria bacterium]|nr:hypothetical protein [Candidatus Eisenbacteria bacterium]
MPGHDARSRWPAWPVWRLLGRHDRLCWLAPGGWTLHRAGLEAIADGAYGEAERLLERAAQRYRRELAVEPLARCRVHQRMAHAFAAGAAGPAPSPEALALALDVDRALARLDTIESPAAPFARVPARALLARWCAPVAVAVESPADDAPDHTLPAAA